MLSIPSDLIAEKNKLFAGGAFLELIEHQMSELEETSRIVNNNEDIQWGGYTWTRFAFEPGDYKENEQGEAPRVILKISNVARIIEGYLMQTDNGFIGDNIIYRLIHSDHLEKDPAVVLNFSVLSVECDELWVYFNLGAENLFLKRFPLHVYARNICRYEIFKGTACGYSGSETSCDRSFARCIELGNEARFGGQPGIPGGLFNL